MATPLQSLRRAGVLALLLAALGSPAWAASGPTARPHAQEAQGARLHAPSAPSARAGDDGTGDGIPGIVPIGLGLLLTGVAVYKHRGLPRSCD